MIYDIQDKIKEEAAKHKRVRVVVTYTTKIGFHYDREYTFSEADVKDNTPFYQCFLNDIATTAAGYWKITGIDR